MSYRKELSFGLDIGDHAIKAIQFRETRKKTLLEAYGEIALPDGLIKGGEILEPKKLASNIKTLLAQIKLEAQNVVIALPESKTFLKIISVPVNSALPVADRVAPELQKHLPSDIGDVWWDFAVIKKEATRLTLLAGAALKQTVNAYNELLHEIPLTPVAFDIEALAIARAVISDKLAGCALIVDIGGTKSTLISSSAETVLATADARSPGDDLTAKLAKSLSITEKAAREMKHKYGLQGTKTEYNNILEQYGKTLLSRIQKMLAYSTDYEHSCPAVSQIILSGGGALLNGLPAFIEKATKIPARIADPWVNAYDSIKEVIDSPTAARFTTVCGLALTSLTYDHGS